MQKLFFLALIPLALVHCQAQSSPASALVDIVQGLDVGHLDNAYAAAVGKPATATFLASVGKLSWADTSSFSGHSVAGELTIDGQSFRGLQQALTASKVGLGALSKQNANLGDYWRSIGFEATKPISAAQFHAALKTTYRLFNTRSAALTAATQPASNAEAASREADQAYKSDSQDLARALVYGLVAFGSAPAAADAGLALDTRVVNNVANPNQILVMGAGVHQTQDVPQDTASYIGVINAAQANNEQAYLFNSKDPDTLQRITQANPQSGQQPGSAANQQPTYSTTINGSVTVAAGGQFCTNANCDQAQSGGSINYPNSGRH